MRDANMRRWSRYTVLFAILVIATSVFAVLRSFTTKSGWASGLQTTDSYQTGGNLFRSTLGHGSGCPARLGQLYPKPPGSGQAYGQTTRVCNKKPQLLHSLSWGGRNGFEAPFSGFSCQYRWFNPTEMCMILSRFDHVVFLGDDLAMSVYKGFNILLREDLGLGGLRQWNLNKDERTKCQCDNQFTRMECSMHAIRSSEEVLQKDAADSHSSPYICSDTPHTYLQVTSSPMPGDMSAQFDRIIEPSDSYKPIPVIHTLSLGSSLSWPAATSSMDEILAHTDAASSGRGFPLLWLGPVAAGHLKPPSLIMSQGNNALWHYTIEMTKEAESRDMDVLNFYNLTIQANSWDGSAYGERVAVVQAMMVFNWLARVDST
ncbi:MAG: hypothetical protein M1814_000797 [Vezdaea aestivalis]|nr:MAG: hypothetical protein M1814_000797 [Vezdaea aestivalis]